MKLLKLINTTDCLKLADCLLGSKNYYSKTDLEGAEREEYESVLQGISLAGNFLVDSSKYGTEFEFEILLPIETLRLNSFKCMENSVNVLITNGFNVDIRDSICMIEKTSAGSLITVGKWNGVHCLGYSVSLDLENLPDGAEIIEQ